MKPRLFLTLLWPLAALTQPLQASDRQPVDAHVARDTPALSSVVAIEQAPFVPIDPSRPQLAQIAVLSGDPATGPSSMLMKFGRMDGAMHVHSSDYRLVVIEGTMQHWRAGESQQDAPLLHPGSFWFQRGEEPHQDACMSERCVMYIEWAGRRDARIAPAPSK